MYIMANVQAIIVYDVLITLSCCTYIEVWHTIYYYRCLKKKKKLITYDLLAKIFFFWQSHFKEW